MNEKKIMYFIFCFSLFLCCFAEDSDVEEDFYSLQNSGLTVCYGEQWFFEQFDDKGNPLASVFYDKDTLLEKRTYTYQDGYKSGVEIILPDKLIKITYNKSGFEIENAVYNASGETLTEKTMNTYNEKNLLVKTVFIKNKIERSSEFEYDANGKLVSQTDFIDGKKISFIAYREDTKIVSLFENGKEIKILKE